jgi:hypothetical protein
MMIDDDTMMTKKKNDILIYTDPSFGMDCRESRHQIPRAHMIYARNVSISRLFTLTDAS